MAGFEEHLTQLETVVEQLERGDLTLEKSMQLFERGMELSQACKLELELAEGRIQMLVEGKGGRMSLVELEGERGAEAGERSTEEEEP